MALHTQAHKHTHVNTIIKAIINTYNKLQSGGEGEVVIMNMMRMVIERVR